MRTWTAVNTDPTLPDDIGTVVVDGIESLRQRIVQRLRFTVGEWWYDNRRGTDRIVGTQTPAQVAAGVLTDAIRDEGGSEVTDVRNVEAVLERRTLTYSAVVITIYDDDIVLSETLS